MMDVIKNQREREYVLGKRDPQESPPWSPALHAQSGNWGPHSPTHVHAKAWNLMAPSALCREFEGWDVRSYRERASTLSLSPHTPYSALRCVLIPSLLSSVFLHYRDLLLVNDGVFSKYKYNFVTINIKYINEDIRTFLNFENQWLKKGAYNSITIIIYIYMTIFQEEISISNVIPNK